MIFENLVRPIRGACRRIVNNKYFSVLIIVLILLSVILIFVDLAIYPSATRSPLQWLNDLFFYIFVIELLIRLIACWDFKEFLREFWIDIVAVVPMLPALRVLRVFRLLRLLRILSLMVMMRRHLRAFKYFFHRNLIEYLVMFTLISFIAFFGTMALVYFEHSGTGDFGGTMESIVKSFWTVVFSMFAGEYVTEYPITLGGKFIIILIMFCNMSLFAIFTGTVTTIMAERFKEGSLMSKLNFHDMEGHIIICGWNDHAPRILSEFQKEPEYKNRNFVIIAELSELPDMSERNVDLACLYLMSKDFTSAEVLKSANIKGASVAIILADMSHDRTSHDADARTVLAALTIEKINPDMYTCAELIHSENEPHLAMSTVESIVLTRKLSALMLTQAAMKEGVLPFYAELIHPSEGNTVYEVPFPVDCLGRDFDDIIPEWKKKYKATLVGVSRRGEELLVNPDDYKIREDDQALIIATRKPKIGK